jgi:diaminopimelate decarboxylase
MPETRRGDLVAIRSAGAYGEVMASGYNMRKLEPAVFWDDL